MAAIQLTVSAEKTTVRKVSISLLCIPYTILSFINKNIQNSTVVTVILTDYKDILVDALSLSLLTFESQFTGSGVHV